MKHVTCEVDYDEQRQMWCVTIYIDGHWDMEQWFHSENAARYWAERMGVVI